MNSHSPIIFPGFDPVIFEIGPLALRWYGVMYLVGFVAAFLLARKRLARTGWTQEQLSDLLFWCFVGVIAGGRAGYVLFYQFDAFLADPLYLFKIWTGGMAFHGGCLGVILAAYLYAKRQSWSFLAVGDFIAPLVPIGLGAGRIGNFINGELWGRVTDVSWGMVFPGAGPLPRHPSQLYEFFFEGLVLFMLLWWYSSSERARGSVGALFLMAYGVFRFGVEFYREPDAHLGLYQIGLSQGQLLCIPMIIAGLWLWIYAHKRSSVSA